MIRPLQNSDRALFLELTKEFYHSPAVLHEVPTAYFLNNFDEALSDSPFLKGYILELDGKPVGFALLSFTYAAEVGGRQVMIEEIYLREQARGAGLGKEFFRFVEEAFPDCRRQRLEVTEENAGARRLYERLGFQPLDYLQMVKDREA